MEMIVFAAKMYNMTCFLVRLLIKVSALTFSKGVVANERKKTENYFFAVSALVVLV